MNTLSGKVKEVQNHGNLSLVKVTVANVDLTSIVIETPDSVDYLREGTSVKVMFKETEVIMSKKMGPDISLQNQIPVTISEINRGALLSELTLDFEGQSLRSVITSRAVEQLDLKPGVEVVAMIKTNEVMLAK